MFLVQSTFFLVTLTSAITTANHNAERQKIADKVREGFLTVSLKDLLVLPRILRRIPELTSFEHARVIVAQSSKPLAMIIEALGQENRLDRLEKTDKLTSETKIFFHKLEDQKKDSVRNAVLLYELQPEAVKKNIQEVFPSTARFFEEHSKGPKSSILDLFPIHLNDSDELSRLLHSSLIVDL